MHPIALSRSLSLCIVPVLLAGLMLGCRSNSAGVSSSGEAAAGDGSAQAASLTMNPTFQSRNPRPCPSVRHKPSDSEAAALVQCTQDSIGRDHITLMQDVVVSVGAGRAYSSADDQQDIDNTGTVYSLKGNESMYMCQIVDDVMKNSGKNCYAAESKNMTGYCYRVMSGDYRCVLAGGDSGWIHPQAAPPREY